MKALVWNQKILLCAGSLAQCTYPLHLSLSPPIPLRSLATYPSPFSRPLPRSSFRSSLLILLSSVLTSPPLPSPSPLPSLSSSHPLSPLTLLSPLSPFSPSLTLLSPLSPSSPSLFSIRFDPGHYICLCHERKAIIVAFRGTFHVRDALTDLVASNTPFMVSGEEGERGEGGERGRESGREWDGGEEGDGGKRG
jgi:hypothetical protein